MRRRGSDKESTLSAEHDGNKILFPPNASMNYRLLSLGHGSLFTFSFFVCVEEQDRKGKENVSSLSYPRVLYVYFCFTHVHVNLCAGVVS